jgi:hypothetical protein
MLTISVNGRNASVSFKSLTRADVVRIAFGEEAKAEDYEVGWRYGTEEGNLVGPDDAAQPKIGLEFTVAAVVAKAADVTSETAAVTDATVTALESDGIIAATPASVATSGPGPLAGGA